MARHNKPYTWTIEITIAPAWVADGFDLSTQHRLDEFLANALGWMRSNEFSGHIIRAPDPLQIKTEQGTPQPGYKPLYEE